MSLLTNSVGNNDKTKNLPKIGQKQKTRIRPKNIFMLKYEHKVSAAPNLYIRRATASVCAVQFAAFVNALKSVRE